MNPRILLSVLLLAATASSSAVDLTGDTPPDGLRALLDTPTLLGNGPCTQRSGGKYQLRAAPSDSAAPVGVLEADPIAAGQNECSQDAMVPRVRKPGEAWTSPVPTREIRHGHPALIVTDITQGWYQIMLGDGEAWMREPPGSALLHYGNLVFSARIRTLPGWDGRVCSTPRLDDCRKMSMPENPEMRIVRMQPMGADFWFKVAFGVSACDGATQPDGDVVIGWVPGYASPDPSGRRPLTLWMDPRGC